MADKKYDVFGVGNAIVDTLAQVDESFISERSLAKGSMALMDSENQAKILTGLEHQNLQLASGGSAANTMITKPDIANRYARYNDGDRDA